MRRRYYFGVILAGLLAVSLKGADKSSELFKAVEENKVAQVEALLKDGINPNVKDKRGYTPLFLAAERGHGHIAATLVKHKADINAANGDLNWTPLHVATDKGHTLMSYGLIRHGADVNATDKYGKTPLHIAAEKGFTRIADLLVRHKANVDAKDDKGKTPLDLARNQYVRDVLNGKRIPHEKHDRAQYPQMGKGREEDQRINEMLRGQAFQRGDDQRVNQLLRGQGMPHGEEGRLNQELKGNELDPAEDGKVNQRLRDDNKMEGGLKKGMEGIKDELKGGGQI